MRSLQERVQAVMDDPPGVDAEPTPIRLQTRCASDIDPLEVDWVWKGWLPAGMLALFAGRGGSGKSTIALGIAAAGSTGGMLPDGQQAPLFNTLVFASEDSPEHTIIPRLKAMEADLDRIHIVDGVAREGNDPDHAQVRAHTALIEEAVDQLDIGLVIIDPISSYIGDANSDKESDVRVALMPLVAMAERTGCAVLMIRHVSKAGDSTHAGSRILGSTAWHDVPRIAWMLTDAPEAHQPEPHEDGTRDLVRVLGVVKSNLAAKPAARMCVQPVDGPLCWKPAPSPVTVDECFFSPFDRGSTRQDAERWAREYLKGGSKESGRLFADGKGRGFSEKTIRRALKALGADSFQLPGKASGGWSWRLPNGDPTTPESDKGSLGQETDRPDAWPSEESDSQGSVGQAGPVRKVTAIPTKSDDPIPPDTTPTASSQLVSWPNSLYRESDQLTQETTSEPLAPTGTGTSGHVGRVRRQVVL